MAREVRSLSRPIEVRAADAGRTIAGYAAIFNSTADIGGMWNETIKPGAFTNALRSGGDILALYSHELERLLGRRSSGTLRLAEDDKGLAIEIDLPDTSDGRDVATLVERGDLKGMSIGMCVTKQEWDDTVTPPSRTISEIELYEVTVTADPAYTDTEIGMRSLEKVRRDAKTVRRDGYLLRKAMLAHAERHIS